MASVSSTTHRRASRRRWFALAALAFGFLGGALLAEIGFRVYLWRHFSGQIARGPGKAPDDAAELARLPDVVYPSPNRRISYRFKPNARCTMEINTLRFPFRTNSLGFRGPEFAKAKPPSTFRIAGLGDSSMWGWGVREEDCYLSALTEALNRSWGGRARFEALNMAAPGYNSVIELELFKDVGMDYGWDFALIQYDLNDSATPGFLQTPKSFSRLDKIFLFDLPGFILGPWNSPKRYIDHRLQEFGSGQRTAQRGPLLTPPEEIPAGFDDMVGWENLVKSYEGLRDLAAERGFPVAVLMRPVRLLDGDPSADRDPDYDQARAMCRRLSLLCVDAFHPLRSRLLGNGLNTMDSWIAPNFDSHPSELAHAVIARELYPVLRDSAAKRLGPPDQPGDAEPGIAWLEERIAALIEAAKARPRQAIQVEL